MKGRFTKVFTQKLEPWEDETHSDTRNVPTPGPRSSDEAPPEASEAYLFALEFPSGNRQVFRGLPRMIGRGEQNDLVLSDPTVSGNHARLYYDLNLNGVCIQDTNSLNGVFVNDLPASRTLLTDGARIRLGGITLIFRQLTNNSL